MGFRTAFVAYALLISVAAVLHSGSYYSGHDGECLSGLAKLALRSTTFSTDLPVNPLQGMSGFSFLVNHWLSPTSLLHAYISHPVLTYAVPLVAVALQVFVATWWLLRGLGLSIPTASIATWLTCLSLFPPFFPSKVNTIHLIGPNVAQTYAYVAAALASFLFLGRAEKRRNLALGASTLVLALLAVLSDPLFLLVFAPVLAPFGITQLWLAEEKERRWKLGFITMMAALAWLVGIGGFYSGLIHANARTLFHDRVGVPRNADQASIVFGGRWNTNYFFIYRSLVLLAVMGAIAALWRGPGLLRRTAATFVAATALFFLMVRAFISSRNSWPFPQPSYFEFALYPFYFGFAAHLVSGLKLVTQRYLMLGTIAAAAVATITLSPEPRPSIAVTPIAEYLKNDLAFAPGRDYRGSVIFQDIDPHQGEYFPLLYGWIYPSLLQLRIPTLHQYSHHIDPMWHVFARRLLLPPGTTLDRNKTPVELTHPRLLLALGVKYVITRCEAPPPELSRGLHKVVQESHLCLFALKGEVNRGHYSPVNPIVINDAPTALAMMQSTSYAPGRQVIVSEPLPGPLETATSVVFQYDVDGYHLRAVTGGQSLLTLPILYSSAWSLEPSPGGERGDATLVRANLVQLGVRFRGRIDVRLRHRFGVFSDNYARLRDLREIENLGARAALEEP